MKRLLPFLLLLILAGCKTKKDFSLEFIDVQGHRGCRGLMPENTIPAFIKAIDIGVNTLEMDAVITADGKVLLSHEPWMDPDFCVDSTGEELGANTREQTNIYRLTYEQIKKYDCGSKVHPKYPGQEKFFEHKPLLSEVIDTVEKYIHINGLQHVWYNIETKCDPRGDGVFHPGPEEFAELLVRTVTDGGIRERTIIQSFDPRTLEYIHANYPDVKLAYLAGGQLSYKHYLQKLGFQPDIFSPNHLLVTEGMVQYMKENDITLIPWTVNEERRMEKLIRLGVDGIITDYPDRLVELIDSLEQVHHREHQL